MEWIGPMQQELSRRKWQIALRIAARARRSEVFLRHTRIALVLAEKTSKQFFGFINAMHVPIRTPSKRSGERIAESQSLCEFAKFVKTCLGFLGRAIQLEGALRLAQQACSALIIRFPRSRYRRPRLS
jgi:hypothetical protein